MTSTAEKFGAALAKAVKGTAQKLREPGKRPAYYIGEHEVHDQTAFADYLKQAIPIIERHGGRYLTEPGTHEILEGHWQPNRVVIVAFPDMASLRAWYHAPDYQPLIAKRRAAARDVMIAIEAA
ncbi:MAG TPA: DUF1330 domain-containing protein [Pseudolabrys sp.]|nr:DUF1330 domain-containing protein [Pseudolabrys sp.]